MLVLRTKIRCRRTCRASAKLPWWQRHGVHLPLGHESASCEPPHLEVRVTSYCCCCCCSCSSFSGPMRPVGFKRLVCTRLGMPSAEQRTYRTCVDHRGQRSGGNRHPRQPTTTTTVTYQEIIDLLSSSPCPYLQLHLTGARHQLP